MNKKNLTIVLLATVTCIIVYLLFTTKNFKIHEYHTDVSLDVLRQKINSELKTTDINTCSILTLDNICRLENKTGSCYFNATLQALFANRLFTLFIIMSKFNTKQVVCIIMQGIAHKMLTHHTTSLLSELDALSRIKTFENCFRRNGGGDPSYCIHLLLHKLDEECFEIDVPGSPKNFYFTEKLTFACDKCGYQNFHRDDHILHEINFGNDLARCLVCSFDIKEYEKQKMMHKCYSCNEFNLQNNPQVNIKIPENLILENGRVIKSRKSVDYITGKMNIQEKLILGTELYELYAIICLHASIDSCHVNTVAKRGDKWYLFDDSSISKIRTLNDKMIKDRAWICLYRRYNKYGTN